MPNAIEDAAFAHIKEKSDASLRELYLALLAGKLLVPLAAPMTTTSDGNTDVPARCIRLPTNEGCLPVFTSECRLFEWQPQGSLYAEMPGSTLFKMAATMSEVDCVFVNYSDKADSPKGPITRPEFEFLAQGGVPSKRTTIE